MPAVHDTNKDLDVNYVSNSFISLHHHLSARKFLISAKLQFVYCQTKVKK
jgi:hypothetical protein